jgi:hypothetical protein
MVEIFVGMNLKNSIRSVNSQNETVLLVEFCSG